MIKLFIVTIAVAFLALFARLQQKSWLAPGAFFAAVWFCYLFVPLLLAPDYAAWPGGYLWVAAAVFALYVGTVAGSGILPEIKPGARKFFFPGAKILIAAATFLGIAAMAITLESRGFSAGSFLSIESLSEMGNDFSVGRYVENYNPPFLARFLLSFVYFACFLGGALFVASRRRIDKLFSFLPFAPAAFFAISMTTRSSIFYPAVIWTASYLAMAVYKNQGLIQLSLKKIVVGAMALALMVASVIALSMLRSQRTSLDYLDVVWSHEKVGVLGSSAAFSGWLENNWQANLVPAAGAFTFSGFFDLAGLRSREIGIYRENVVLGDEKGITNVYTIFRGLIEDYTLPGSLLILFLFGLLAGIAYRRLSAGERFFVPAMAIFYSVTIWSYFVNLYNYNSIVLGWLIFLFYVILLDKTHRA